MSIDRLVMTVGLIVGVTLLGASRGAERNTPPERTISAAEREHWAYQPLLECEPPEVNEHDGSQHPVDRFIWSAIVRRLRTCRPWGPTPCCAACI